MVFYLKYRPKKISDLDSSDLREKLESILSVRRTAVGNKASLASKNNKLDLADSIPHAFLFTGPKGLGKTSTARILAKIINCTNRKFDEYEPCNRCSSCKAIDSGSNLDVVELDAASNRGIDEIRDLREKIRLAPLSSHKKVYIIDEVHMLTTEAFNALLKTLEEPPSHAEFILCTTEPQKIPATILSRCFNVKFERATDEDLVHSLGRIAKGEDLKVDKEALLAIAQLSDGAFRDGAKILEELSVGTKEITAQTVEKKFKTAGINKSIENLVNALSKKDAKKGIEIIDSLSKEGVDFKLFTENLINYLHANLISQVEGKDFALSLDQTRELLEKLVRAYSSIKYAVLPQLPLELLVVEWCSESEVESLPKSLIEEPKKESPSASLPTPKPTSSAVSKDDKILEDLIESLKSENFSVAGVLRGCKVEKFDNNTLTLSTSYKFHRERLSEKKTLEMLEKNLKSITGKEVKVEIV